VVSEQTAFQITTMLADVVDRGTGWQARQSGFRLPAAGKTGTTNDYRDAWFVGYTPDLVAGVWVGFDRPRTIVGGGYASELAVPIWGAFMRDATAGTKGRPFSRPGGLVTLEICQSSGLLPGPACRVRRLSGDGTAREASAVTVEYFRRGTEPTDECPIHDYSWFGTVRTASIDASEFPAGSTVGVLRRRAQPAPDRPAPPADERPATAPAVSRDEQPRDERRGFWSRLAGVFTGRDRDRDRDGDAPRPSERKESAP
jgi:penicillin-binding protein 1A